MILLSCDMTTIHMQKRGVKNAGNAEAKGKM
jgi:hypothetical protein